MITTRESIYLSFLRAVASLVVLIGHAAEMFNMPLIPLWGHQAVMFFFVLSGYVISYTAATRETNLRAFIIARVARLWSVLGPAILLTVTCDVIGRTFAVHPEAYAHMPSDHPLIRTVAVLTLTAETWVSIQPFSNGAVWSLCAEFWYYLLFAAAVFTPSRQIKFALLGVFAVLAGHKALVLLPVWLLGVALFSCPVLRRLNTAANISLFVGAGAVALFIMATRIYDPVIDLSASWFNSFVTHHLAQARVFWFDWLFGLLVAAHLLGARAAVQHIPLERCSAIIRRAAGVSFAAYLFHMPLLVLCSAFLAPGQGWIAVILTLTIIAVLGPPVERSKRLWSDALNRIVAAAQAQAQVVRGVGRHSTVIAP